MTSSLPPELESLPASCEVVYRILDAEDGGLTQQEIADRTVCSRTTIRRAAAKLVEVGLADYDTASTDLRVKRYYLVEGDT